MGATRGTRGSKGEQPESEESALPEPAGTQFSGRYTFSRLFSKEDDQFHQYDSCQVSKRPRTDAAGNITLPLDELPEDFDNSRLSSTSAATDALLRSPAAKKSRIGTEDPIEQHLGRPRTEEKPKVLRRIPEGDFESVTLSDGQRFYIRKTEDGEEKTTAVGNAIIRPTKGLLSIPYSALLTSALAEQDRMESQTASESQTPMELEEASSLPSAPSAAMLWVEKFRPRAYMDLLSDDGTNRVLLQWLKLWDKVVFGREPSMQRQAKKAQQQQQQDEAAGQKQVKGSSFKKDGGTDGGNRKPKRFQKPTGPAVEVISDERPNLKVHFN